MAAGSVISLGIAVDGEATFKSALSAIDADIRSLSAGVEATDAAMRSMGETEELAAQRNDQLAAKMDALNQKLQVIQTQYDNAAQKLEELAEALEEAQEAGDPAAIEAASKAYNAQAKVVADLSTKMSKTETEISKTADAMDEGGESAEDMGDSMEEASGGADKMASSVQSIASMLKLSFVGAAASTVINGIKAIGQACADAVRDIVDLTTAAGRYADELLTLSQQTGIDPIDLQRWAYASQFIDTEVDTITGSMRRLTMNMATDSGAAGAAFAQLGISVTDSAGNMRSAEEVFWEAIDALGNIANETERDQLAMAMFGRSAQELNPLILAGSEAFKKYGDEAEQMGIILDGEALGKLGALDDAMNKLNSTITGAGNAIAVAFAPALETIIGDVQQVVEAFIGVVQGVEGSKEDLVQAIDTLCTDVGTALEELLPVALEIGVELITTLAGALADNMDVIIDAAVEIILALVQGLVDNIDKLLEAGEKLIDGLRDGWEQAKPAVIAKLAEIVAEAAANLVSKISDFIDVGKQWVEGIWEGIKNTADWLWEQVKGFFGGIIQNIKGLFGIHSPSRLMRDEIGKPIVEGMAEGITDNVDLVQDAYMQLLPDAGMLTQASDGFSVAARAAAGGGGSVPWQDDRPIILQLNDRELGRAVRGYV